MRCRHIDFSMLWFRCKFEDAHDGKCVMVTATKRDIGDVLIDFWRQFKHESQESK